MKRHYEVVYIFESALDEAAVNERLTRFNALLGQGVTPTLNHWGKRSLAQPIGRHVTGYYVVSQFEAEASVLPEFERAIKLEDSVIRSLTVVIEGEPPKPIPVVAAAEEEE
jgi:small subunit ribosomal protein S6